MVVETTGFIYAARRGAPERPSERPDEADNALPLRRALLSPPPGLRG